jgi:hypothetical protein
MAFETTQDGHPILHLTDMRAGHWPFLKSPPWGMTELAQDEVVRQFNLTVDAQLCFPAVLQDKHCGLVPVKIKRRVSGKMVGIFAHPTEEQWWTFVPDPED